MLARLRRDVRDMFTELRDYRDLLVLDDTTHFILQYPTSRDGVRMGDLHAGHQHGRLHPDLQAGGENRDRCALSGVRVLRFAALESVRDVSQEQRQHTRHQQGAPEQGFFPREVFPFSTMLVSVVDFTIGLSILALMMLYYWIPLSATALFLPILIVVQLMFTTGLAMLLAPANLYYRDVKYILDVLVAVGMFATPVIYPTRQVTGTLGVVSR